MISVENLLANDLRESPFALLGGNGDQAVFVLDRSDLIRYKDLPGPELRAAVAVLLDEDGGID